VRVVRVVSGSPGELPVLAHESTTMDSTQTSVESSKEAGRSPPKGFESIKSIDNMTGDQIKKGPLVNVIGMVKDYMAPVATKGTGKESFLNVSLAA
jgi:hypothetical protein